MESKDALATTVVEDTDESQEIVIPASADKVDRVLVERSVKHIRAVLDNTVTRGLDEVGQYLLKEFFNDDPEVFFASGPTRHASLRKLIERSDSIELPVGKTFLVNALRVAVVTRALPRAATFNQLPPSHRVELLRVRQPEKLEKLATRAAEGKLSVLKLRALVQKSELRKTESPGRGRTASPGLLKAIERCLRSIRNEETGKLLFRRSDVMELTDEQQARVGAAFKVLEKRLSEMRRILR